jgi:putative hydrolase of the HAD superfamily
VATRPRAIKAVTLDCWGTLLLDGPGSDDRYRRRRLSAVGALLAHAGVPAAPADLARAYEELQRRLGRLWRECRDVSAGEHVRMLLGALDGGLPERLPPAALAAIERAYAEPALVAPPAVDPGAATALPVLRGRGLALAVVSNTAHTPGAVLRQVFDRAGVLAPLSVLTFSDECGVRKPDPGIFELTLRRLGVRPHETVHVGDDPVLDVEGATDAGLVAIQVSPDGRATAPVKPAAVITGLGELPGALGRLGVTP